METLLSQGFKFVGEWRSPLCRVHRAAWLKRQPGIYAFVIDDVVHYVGMAATLHRRLRNYSNRCFVQNSARPLRYCHSEIAATIAAGGAVQVFAKLVERSSLRVIEAELILLMQPAWNRAL